LLKGWKIYQVVEQALHLVAACLVAERQHHVAALVFLLLLVELI
jgi:hypothetical protein